MPRLLILAALSLIALVACDESPSAPSPTGTTVSIVANSSNLTTTAYAPNPVVISVGDTVTWVNNDQVVHTSTSAGQWDSGTIPPGRSTCGIRP